MFRSLPILALAALVASCGIVLDLPQPPEEAKVTIRSIVSERPSRDPTLIAAFSGDILTIEGEGFDPDPRRNEVQFPLARTQPLVVEGSSIKVQVPPDAGTGPITVSTVSKRGQASEQSFTYLGLGHPRRGAEVARRSLRFAPDWTGVVGDTIYSWGDLGLVVDVTAGVPLALPPLCATCDRSLLVNRPVVLPDGTGLLLSGSVRDSTVTAVWRPDSPATVEFGPVAPGVNARFELYPVPIQRISLAWLVRTQGTATLLGRVNTIALDTWLSTPVPIDAKAVVAALDANRAVVTDADASHPGTWVLEVGGGVTRWRALPIPLSCFGLQGGVADRVLCLRSPDGGSATQVVSLGLDAGGSPSVLAAFPAIPTSAPTVLAVPSATGGVLVIMAFEDRGLVIAYDEATGAVRWGFPVALKPAGLSYDSSDPDHGAVVFADKDSRDVWKLDAETGAAINHRWSKPELGIPAPTSISSLPRASVLVDSYEARAFAPDPASPHPRLRIATPTITTQGLAVDLFGLAFEYGYNQTIDATFYTASGEHWAYRIEDQRLFPLDLEGGGIGQLAVGRAPASLDVAADGTRGIAFPDALELWDETSQLGVWTPSADDYGGSVKLRSVRALPDGRWIVGLATAKGIELVAFTREAILAGEPPAKSLTLDDCNELFWIAGRVDVVCGPDRKSFGTDLEPLGPPARDDVGGRHFVVSPDGRYVAFEQQYADGSGGLTLGAVAVGEPMRKLAEVPLPYRLTGLAFTDDGEKLLGLASDTVIRIE